LITRRPWAARSRAVSRAARATSRFPPARALPASSAAWAMAAMFPAASAVTAGSGSVAASACWPWAVPSAVTGAGWLASAVLPAGSASGCPGSAVLLAPGVSAGGASPPVASGTAAGFQVSAMPGLLPLIRVAVPFFSCAIRACRAAAVLIPARAAITATAAPPGSADRAARTAAAGLSPAAGATGAGAGVVAASAALRAACGAGFLVRAMMVTPFPILRRYSGFHLPAPVFSGRQLLWSGHEVKRLRHNSRCRFPPGPAGTEIDRPPVLTWHDNSRHRLGRRFPGRQPDRILTFRGGCRDFSRAQRLFFFRAFIPVPRSGARAAFPRVGGARESRGGPTAPGGGRAASRRGGQAVRALAVTARATAWLVAAGSARMTTFVPVMVLAVSLGAIQMTRQPEAARRVMSFWPSACWVPL